MEFTIGMINKNKSIKINALLNIIKQFCSALFPYITFSYASHILGSSNIGDFSYAQSLVNYFCLFAGLGITDYAIRECAALRDNKDKLGLFCNEVFTINTISMIIASIALIFFTISPLVSQNLRSIILIMGLQMVLSCIGADWINSAFEDFTYLTIRYIVIGLICVGAIFVFVRNSDDILPYTIITLISISGGNIFNVIYIKRYVNLKITRPNLGKHYKAILVLFFNKIALTIYLNSDITLLGIMTNNNIVGYYSAATKIYLIIKSLINAMTMVTLPRLSFMIDNNDNEECNKLISKVFNYLVALIIPSSIGVFCMSKNLIYVVAGADFFSGQTCLKIYSFTIIFAVFSCLFSYGVLIPFHQEKWFMISTIIASIVNVLLNLLLIPVLSLNGAALTTLIAEIIVFAISFYHSRRHIKLHLNMADIKSELLGSFIVTIVCIISKNIFSNYLISLILAVIISIISYFLILTAMKNSISREILSTIKNKIGSKK